MLIVDVHTGIVALKRVVHGQGVLKYAFSCLNKIVVNERRHLFDKPDKH